MSRSHALSLLIAVLAGFAAGAAWRSTGGSTPRVTGATNVEALRAERDTLREELMLARRARRRSQTARGPTERADERAQESGARPVPAGAESAEVYLPEAPDRGPHRPLVVVAGFENAATWADWWLVGALVRHRRQVSAERARIVAEGGDPDEVEDGGWATEWMDDGGDQLWRALPAQLGSSPEAAAVHPVVTANVMASVLEQSGLPLSHDQMLRLAEVSRRWGERETPADARAAESGSVSFMRRLVSRAERRETFLAEAFSVLSAAQSAALRPPPDERVVGNDYFSAAPVLAPYADAYWGPPNGEWSLGEFALRADGPGLRGEPETVWARVLDLALQWERTVPEEHWPYHPSGDVDQYRVEFLLGVTKALARLHDSWLNDAGLGVGARSNLREPQDIFMVQGKRPTVR